MLRAGFLRVCLTLALALAAAVPAARAADTGGACTPSEALGDAGDASSAIAANVPPGKRTKANLYLAARDAGPLIAAHAKEVLFVDIRTRGELVFVGMPVGVDGHVPFWLDPTDAKFDAEKGTFVLDPNPDFVAAIDRMLAAKGLTRGDPVVLICQGGGRAARAANVLTDAGFAQPWIIVDGFEGDPAPDGPGKGLRTVNGWRNAGLAWTTRLDPAKMYRLD